MKRKKFLKNLEDLLSFSNGKEQDLFSELIEYIRPMSDEEFKNMIEAMDIDYFRSIAKALGNTADQIWQQIDARINYGEVDISGMILLELIQRNILFREKAFRKLKDLLEAQSPLEALSYFFFIGEKVPSLRKKCWGEIMKIISSKIKRNQDKINILVRIADQFSFFKKEAEEAILDLVPDNDNVVNINYFFVLN